MSLISTQNIGLGVAATLPLAQPQNSQNSFQSTLYTTPAGQLIQAQAVERAAGKFQADKDRGGPQSIPNKRPEANYAPQSDKKGKSPGTVRAELPGGRLLVSA